MYTHEYNTTEIILQMFKNVQNNVKNNNMYINVYSFYLWFATTQSDIVH